MELLCAVLSTFAPKLGLTCVVSRDARSVVGIATARIVPLFISLTLSVVLGATEFFFF